MKKRIIGLFTIACIFVLLLPTLSVRAGDTSSFGKYNTISIGSSHSAAIKSDGSLWTWGINCNGQLGDGTTEDRYTPKKIMDDVIAVSVEFYNSAAIKSDGSLWPWGANYNWQLGDGIVADHRYMP